MATLLELADIHLVLARVDDLAHAELRAAPHSFIAIGEALAALARGLSSFREAPALPRGLSLVREAVGFF